MTGWFYDIVEGPMLDPTKPREILALCFHPEAQYGKADHPSCLTHDREILYNEGLLLTTSEFFPTIEAAKASAWKEHSRFSKGLD